MGLGRTREVSPARRVYEPDGSWQETAAHKWREETDIMVYLETIDDFRVLSLLDGRVLFFWIAQPVTRSDLPIFAPSQETSDGVFIASTEGLAFPLHGKSVEEYF